jgi:hypothetical protein
MKIKDEKLSWGGPKTQMFLVEFYIPGSPCAICRLLNIVNF